MLSNNINHIMNKLENSSISAGQIHSKCPYCKSIKNKFYVDKITLKFFCHSCNEKGGSNKLSKVLGLKLKGGNIDSSIKIDFDDALSNYRKVEGVDPIASYMLGRGISIDTISKVGFLTDSKGNTLVMPSNDEAGNIVGVKYRTKDKKIYMRRGSEQILVGIDVVNSKVSNRLYITEGEIDFLTLIEIGIDNVVSVPNGTSNMNWVDKNWDKLHEFDEIILCMDNDDAGIKALDQLKSSLDFTNIGTIDIGQWNDINECHIGDPELLITAVSSPTISGVDGFMSLKDVSTRDGVNMELMSTGISGLDRIFGGIGMYQSTVIAAEASVGKSTLMSNLIKGILYAGEKVAIWSGELSNPQLKSWVYSTIVGNNGLIEKDHPFRPGDVLTSIEPEMEVRVDKLVDGKLFTYSSNRVDGFKMLKDFELLYKRNGVRFFIVDNLSIIDTTVKGKGQYEGEAEFSKAVASFTRNNPIHLFMVSHLTKVAINNSPDFLDKSGKVKPIERYTQQSIRGSASIVNLAHNVLTMARVKDHERAFFLQQVRALREKQGDVKLFEKDKKLIENDASVFMYLVKNRSFGYMYEDFICGYDQKTRRIYGLHSKEVDLSKEILEKEDNSDSEFIMLSEDEEI